MHKLRVLGGLAERVGALWRVLVTGSGAMAYGPSELTGAVIALLEKRWVGVAECRRCSSRCRWPTSPGRSISSAN